MSLIRLNHVSVGFDKTPVLREAFFRLEPGDRVGLIGKNGSGKSTILKLVLGQVAPDTGTVALDQGIRTAYFSQFSELNGESSIAEVLYGLFAHMKAIQSELASIDAALAADSGDRAELDRLIHRQSGLFEDMDRLGGWDYGRTIDKQGP
jgi:ATP-binding cassette subfamily F protein 3